MNIRKFVLPVATGLAVFSVVVASVFFIQAQEMKNKLGYEEHILKSYEVEEVQSSESAVPVDEMTSENAEEEQNTSSVVNIIYNNGFKVKDSSFVLKDVDKNIEANVFIPGENFIQYTYGDKTIIVNDTLKISVVSTDDISFENISKFETESGTIIIVGQKKLNETTGISLVYEIENNQEIIDSAVKYVQQVLDNSKISINNMQSINIFNKQISDGWGNFAMNDKYISFNNSDNNIYLSTFNLQLTGSGLDKSLKIDGLDVVYGNYKDANTGLIPYIIKLENGNIKMLATSNDLVTSFFAS